VKNAREGRKLFVTVSLTSVYSFESRPIGRGLGGIQGSRGRVRCPRADLQPAPGRHSGINRLALRPGRDENSLGWDRQGRVTPAQRDTQNVSPPSPWKRKSGVESLAMKDSLGREPRWNADRCAPGAPGAAVPQESLASVGVSPPNLFRSFFLSFLRHART
jgi:hypothetical protein